MPDDTSPKTSPKLGKAAADGSTETRVVEVSKRDETFLIDLPTPPTKLAIDKEEKIILKNVKLN